ncbi:MAG: hypothetical protein JNL87_01135 [Burkholderiaceae bacterium]|nr:hypothetical protein [Burkholderiaceae bacterium]
MNEPSIQQRDAPAPESLATPPARRRVWRLPADIEKAINARAWFLAQRSFDSLKAAMRDHVAELLRSGVCASDVLKVINAVRPANVADAAPVNSITKDTTHDGTA